MWILMMSWLFFYYYVKLFIESRPVFLSPTFNKSLIVFYSQRSLTGVTEHNQCYMLQDNNHWSQVENVVISVSFQFQNDIFLLFLFVIIFFFGCFWHLFEHYIDPKMFRQFF